MLKCDACNNNCILPEQLGDSVICKKCLLKINGIMWKYRTFEKSIDLENNRNKAIELARKNNYPDKVILGINKYFDNQKSNMQYCEVCGAND